MRLWGLLLLSASILYGQGDYIVNLRRLNGITLTGANVVDGTNSAIRVTCQAGTCGGAATFADNSAFTAGTTGITNIGGVFNDGLAAVPSGSAAAPRITNFRALHFNLRDSSGNEVLSVAAAPAGTERGLITRNIPSGTQVVSGSGTFNTDPIDRAARVLGRAFLRNPGDTANMGDTTTPMRIDPTGVTTQPVSGTVTANQGGGTWTVQGGLADNGVAASTNRVGTLPAIAQSNLPAAGIAGRDAALITDLNRRLITAILPSGFATYTASKQGLVPAASPTDIAVLPGNATNTVVVVRVEMSCTQTTAGVIDVQLIKRSTADSAGTSTAITVVPLDSNNAAGVSAPLTYTANPTLGTVVGTVDAKKIFVPAPATTGNDFYLWMPDMGQSVTLRGTAQQIAINLNGVTLTGGNCNITFKWIETTGL